MASSTFPTFQVEGVHIPKALIGINSLLGYSHTSRGRDAWIRRYYDTPVKIGRLFAFCIERGMKGVLGPIQRILVDAIKAAEDISGEGMIFVSTTIGPKDETAQQLKMAQEVNTPICCLHGGWLDGWPIEGGRFKDLEDYPKMIRDAGMIPGTACHDGERMRLAQKLGYDLQLFVIPVNRMGFKMNPSKEAVLEAVAQSTKPVIAIKPLASGRFDENRIEEWLGWTYSQKGVCGTVIGFMSEEEAEEDIEILRRILIGEMG